MCEQAKMLRTIDTQFLRQLRRLDRDWQAARHRLESVRVLVDSLPADRPDLSVLSDLSELEALEAAAREAYDAHAAQQPALSQEYADRAELADAVADARRKEHMLGLLLTAAVPSPNPAAAEAATGARLRAEARRAALVTQASAVDAEYQAACAEPESDWLRIGRLHAKGEALRAALGDAETQLANAERREREARAKAERIEAMAVRRVSEIELARAELARVRAYADELRARLPETVSAPLRERRTRDYGAPAPPELHGAIRERYRYEPATDTLHRLPRGELVRATQSVLIDGHRIPRAAVVAVLAPPSTIRPEDLA